jgi:putative hydrolase of HD superfamily
MNIMNDEYNKIADFLFESGMLAKTPRSGFSFLGSGEQSVAEHSNRVAYIGYVLSEMIKDADSSKIIQMCMFHDLAEARVSDLNYVHQKYTKRYESRAVEDLTSSLPFGHKIKDVIEEYEKRETLEAKIAKDADNLEFLLSLKEQKDIGNTRAETWIPSLIKRIKLKESKILAEKITKRDSDYWWFHDKEDEWWISRNNGK